MLHYLSNFLGMLNLLAKASFGVTFMMWVRWTLPRLRIDQVMVTCLKYCTPIAAVMFVGVTLWTYFLPGGLLFGPTVPLGAIREGWNEVAPAAAIASRKNEVAAARNIAATPNHEER